MLSFDGAGYGKSTAWEVYTSRAAVLKHERCPCWDDTESHFTSYSDPTAYKNVKIKVFCKAVGCTQKFEETEKYITQKFHDFYGT